MVALVLWAAPASGAGYDGGLPFALTRGLWQGKVEASGRGVGVAMALPVDIVSFPFRLSPGDYDTGYFFALSRGVLAQPGPESEPAYQALLLTGPLDLALLPVAGLAGLAGPNALASSRGVKPMDYTPWIQVLGSFVTVPLDLVTLPLALLFGFHSG